MIQDIIKNIKYQDYKSITYKDLGLWLENNNVFDDLYGSTSHSQLIQRSSDFLRFLINEELLTIEHLTIIWRGIEKGDIQTKLSIYKMITDLSMSFNAANVEFLVDRISNIEISKLTKEDIELLYELARFSNKGGDYGMRSLDFLWKILGESKTKVSLEIFELVLEKTGELASSYYLRDYRMQIIEKCIKNIENNYAVFPSLKIFNKTLSAYPEKVLGHFTNIQTSKGIVCEELVNKCNIIEVIFKNLADFKAYLKEKLQNMKITEITEPILNKYIKDHTNYLEHITERVLTLQNIVKSLPEENPLKHNFSLLSKLWDEIVENYLIPLEENVLFRWIKEFCDFEKETSVKDFSETIAFLNEKMLNNSQLVETLSMDGMVSFKSMFLSVNRHLKNIEIISKAPEREEYSISFIGSTKDSSANGNTEEKVTPHILVLVEPEILEGINFLWDCCLENCSEYVSSKSVEFLNELYSNNIKTDEESRMNIRQGYIKKCFSVIEKCTESKESRDETIYSRKIIRTISAINSFLDESEKAGIGTLKSHNANVKGEIITISVYNDNIMIGSNFPKNIDLKVNSNDTLYSLRMEVAKTLQTSWDAVIFLYIFIYFIII